MSIKLTDTRLGLMSACNSIAALTGIPISGSLIIPGTWSNGFGPMIVFSGIMATLGAVSYIAARVMMVGWKIHIKR
jgi:fucose permease